MSDFSLNDNLFSVALGEAGRRAKLRVLLVCVTSGVSDVAAVAALALVMARFLGLPMPEVAILSVNSGGAWPEIFVFVAASCLRLFCNYETARIGQYGEANISTEIFSRLIDKDIDYLGRFKNSDFKRQILSEVQQASNHYLYPVLRIAQAVPSAVLISVSLVVTLPDKLMISFVLLATILGSLIYLTRKIGSGFGERRFLSNEKRFLELERTFTNIRFIKTLSLGEAVAGRFFDAMSQYAYAQTAMQVLSQAPKFILEIILVVSVGLSSSAGAEWTQNGSMAVLLAAAYRLIPIAQVLTQNMGRLSFGRRAVEDLNERLASLSESRRVVELGIYDDTAFLEVSVGEGRAFMIEELCVRDIAIDLLSTTVLMGESGVGKTTFLDVIAGLKTSDNVLVTGRGVNWMEAGLFYLPQQAFLPDGDIFEVLGYFDISPTSGEIERALTVHNLSHLSNRLLSDRQTLGGSQEFSGLSGGELKRLFLLAGDLSGKSLILLDEPFVGLDRDSADQMASSINNLAGRRTIILVTHSVPQVLRYDRLVTMRTEVNA